MSAVPLAVPQSELLVTVIPLKGKGSANTAVIVLEQPIPSTTVME